jgi:hypothetical protein
MCVESGNGLAKKFLVQKFAPAEDCEKYNDEGFG